MKKERERERKPSFFFVNSRSKVRQNLLSITTFDCIISFFLVIEPFRVIQIGNKNEHRETNNGGTMFTYAQIECQQRRGRCQTFESN
jgi:hypothetical protein